MIRRIWRRVSDWDRLAFWMVVCFGLSLLMIISAFQAGWKIGEDNQVVRAIEFVLAFGLIWLGIDRLRNLRKRRKGGSDGH